MKFRVVPFLFVIVLLAISAPAAPIITTFWPMVGASNDTDFVNITGTGFFVAGHPPSVKFNGVESSPAATVGDTFGTNILAHVAPGTPLGSQRIVVTVNGAMTQSGSFFTVIGPQQPYVTNFTPIIGGSMTPVVVQGVHFFNGSAAKQVSAVSFNVINGSGLFVASDNEVDVNAPNNVSTGPLVVVTPQGSFNTLSNTVSPATNFFVPPVITAFSPSNGRANTNVVITGSNFLFTTSVTFNGLTAGFTIPTNNTTLRVTVPVNATTGKITVNTPANNPFTTTSNFVMQPTIFNFSPPSGIIGTMVTVNGANFDAGGFSVKFGGVTASTHSTPTFGSFTVTVPNGATNAPITVTTVDGSSTSAALFYLPPFVTSFAPTHGLTGTNVTLMGTNFLGVTSVQFNGTAAMGFTNVNNNQINAVAPVGVTTGPISVTGPAGTFTTPTSFTVDSSDIGVSLNDVPDPVFIGSNLVYTITVTNNGPLAAPNVRVTNSLPASVGLVAAVTSQGSLNTNVSPILGTLGTLNTGSPAVITLTVIPRTAGSIVDSASAGSDFPDTNPANNSSSTTTTVWPVPVLSIINLTNQVQVLWPAPLSNFTLQFTPALGAAYGWTNFGVAPIISGTNSLVTDSITNAARLYRLKQ